jgi:acetoin utilization protein AcuB
VTLRLQFCETLVTQNQGFRPRSGWENRQEEKQRMLVREIMTKDPVTTSPKDTLRTAIQKMASIGCRRLPVLAGGRLVGIVANLDIREALNSPIVLRERWQDEELMDHAIVEACMTPNPLTVAPDTPVIEAARLMRDRKIGGLPVMDGNELVGIVTETDLLDALIKLLS